MDLKMKLNLRHTVIILLMFLNSIISSEIQAQTETMAWGNITGTRIDGELIQFETSIRLVKDGFKEVISTKKEEQNPHFKRNGNTVTVNSKLGNVSFQKKVTDISEGNIEVEVRVSSDSSEKIDGIYFCIELPSEEYKKVNIELIDAEEKRDFEMPEGWENIRRWWRDRLKPVRSRGAEITSAKQHIKITADNMIDVIVLKGNPFWGNPNTLIYFSVISGNISAGQEAAEKFKILADTEIDRTPVTLKLNVKNPGKVFDGIGGNFRLQDPVNDPPVIDYNLENLNVAWGRVEMPWSSWHRNEHIDPLETAGNGNLNERVKQAMLMAQKLAKNDIPVILSAWSAPDWAIVGERRYGEGEDGLRGNPLNKKKMRSIVKSIGSYILYMKEEFGVEPALFSFNESDLGIYIRHTGEEHAEFIKILGKHFASMGLSTKLLLGDNSDANTYEFTTPALNDPETHKYLGAVSFHSWRGYDNWTLSIWADIASQLNLPLLVGEGSIDASAHSYPEIFLEPSYAIEEIDVYLRILNICQARSILQWQLTSDYSVLTGQGIYDSEGSLKPTQRFWNLKQLGLTPKGSFNLAIESDSKNISCAAFGDIKNNIYTIHIVNNGPTRKTTLEGLPKNIKNLRMYITDSKNGMKEETFIKVADGSAVFDMQKETFTTLLSYE
jgi:hypothetical protein